MNHLTHSLQTTPLNPFITSRKTSASIAGNLPMPPLRIPSKKKDKDKPKKIVWLV